MTKARLDGRVILIVEDEPLVALDVIKALRDAGARVLSAGYVEFGLYTTENPDLSAAVIDLPATAAALPSADDCASGACPSSSIPVTRQW